jgi:hypothetical protein
MAGASLWRRRKVRRSEEWWRSCGAMGLISFPGDGMGWIQIAAIPSLGALHFGLIGC